MILSGALSRSIVQLIDVAYDEADRRRYLLV